MTFETREQAWDALADALATMLDKPKSEWPEDVEEQRAAAQGFLDENPPTPATVVTMRLAQDSLAEVVEAVKAGVLELWDEDDSPPRRDNTHDVEQVLHEAYLNRMGLDDSDLEPPLLPEESELPADILAEASSEDPVEEPPVSENSDGHVCRANLDIDDICTVCGRDCTPRHLR